MSAGETEEVAVSPESQEDEDEEDIGPLPLQPRPKKRRRVVVNETAALDSLPCTELYEKSYLHREVLSHVVTSAATGFVISASWDGHVKFWKKKFEGIEFVKHFRAHLGKLRDISISCDELFLASVGEDEALKVFDIVNFDMSSMVKLEFSPLACCFVHQRSSPEPLVAVSHLKESTVSILRTSQSPAVELRVYSAHQHPVHSMRFNPSLNIVSSCDKSGAVELWHPDTLKFPSNESTRGIVMYNMKMDTDFFELQKCGTFVIAQTMSLDGTLLALLCEDEHIRIFSLPSGKLIRVYDESLDMYSAAQSDPLMEPLHLDQFDFGKRVAVEKEIRKSESLLHQNLVFDESGSFLIYPSLVGIKITNIQTNKLVRVIGKPESGERFLFVALYQGAPQKQVASGAILTTSGEKTIKHSSDPLLVTTAYKKKRFFIFSRREPSEATAQGEERDVFNEMPTREEQLAATTEILETPGDKKLGKTAVIHTTMGDISIRLFHQEVPRTVENFTVHSRNGYYDNCIFHRVIRNFMIQTGDPNGDGTGGESIWGGEFEDEFNRALKHDRPYTLSMANAGPNTNGSQFFITTVPCPWLDGKHSVFGRVVSGMDVVHRIENVRTISGEKPFTDIKILAIKITS